MVAAGRETDMETIVIAFAAALAISVGAAFAALSMRWISTHAIDGMTRQPDIAPQLFTAMLIGMALVEALAIYCLVVALMLASSVTIIVGS